MKKTETMKTLSMNTLSQKRRYTRPDIELVCGAQQLLDSFPVHWSEENDNPIEANQNTLFDETETYEPATSLWELHPDSTNRPQSE